MLTKQSIALAALFAGTSSAMDHSRHQMTDGDLTADYWLETDAETDQTKLVCKMTWTNFEEPTTPEGGENKTVDNDNVRIFFNFKPQGSQFYESCNFFMREWNGDGDLKVWDGVKHWTQSADDLVPDVTEVTGDELLFSEPAELIDPKGWCAMNWENEMNTKPTGCKLRSQKIEERVISVDDLSTEGKTRNAFNSGRKMLTLEWERPLKMEEQTAQDIVLEQMYDIKMYYGMFNHDGEEEPEKLSGGKQHTLTLDQSDLAHSAASLVKPVMAALVGYLVVM